MDVTVGIADDVGVMVAPVQRRGAAIAAIAGFRPAGSGFGLGFSPEPDFVLVKRWASAVWPPERRTGVAGLGDGIAGGRFLNGVERASGKICDHERFAALELDRSLAVREGHGGGGAVLGCVIAAGGTGGAVDLDQEVECGVRVDAFADFLGNGESAGAAGDDLAAIGV